MSCGPGFVQRRLIAAFKSEPTRRFTIEQLAEIAFPGEPIERKHVVGVRRALKKLKNLPGLDLHHCRAGRSGARGWLTSWGVSDKCCFLRS